MAVEVMVVAEIVVAEVANVFVAASDKRDTSTVPPRREKPFKKLTHASSRHLFIENLLFHRL